MKQVIWVFISILACIATAFAQTEKTPCPTLKVTGGGVVQPGQPMTFTVNIAGLNDASALKYKWEISNGTIASDPEAQAITIDTTGLSGSTNITAKVKVEGLPENCANTGSETGATIRNVDFFPFDEFGKLSNNDVLARIQNLYVELSNYPDARGFIFNYGTANEIAAREKQIQRAIKRLRLDLSRVAIINAGKNPWGAGVWTQVWNIPPGVDTSTFVDILTNKDKD